MTSPEAVPSVSTAEVPLEVAPFQVFVHLLFGGKFAAHEEHFSVVLGLVLPVFEHELVSPSSGLPFRSLETCHEGFLVDIAIGVVC